VRALDSREKGEREAMTQHTACRWEEDEDGVWSTDCGQEFVFIDSGPRENKMLFCCYCGALLKATSAADMNPRAKDEDDGQRYGHPADHLAERRGAMCRVPSCIAEVSDASLVVCQCHQSLSDAELDVLLHRKVGLVAQLEPLTDRIEYQQACGCEHNTRLFTKRCENHKGVR
jgi:hypothetical protein